MERGIWMLAALVLGLGGWYLVLLDLGGWLDYLAIGLGVGVACSVVGSLAHDALTSTGGRR